MNPRLTKAVNGLKQTAEEYDHKYWFEFSDEVVLIKPPKEKPVWIWLCVLMFIGLPVTASISLLIKDNPEDFNLMIFFFIVTVFGMVFLRSLLKGTKTIKIDFNNKQFTFTPVNALPLGKNEATHVPFSQVSNIKLKNRHLPNKITVLRMYFNDQDGITLSYVDFLPEHYSLAEKIRRFADVAVRL